MKRLHRSLRRSIAYIVGILFCLLCVQLAQWQTHRAAYKLSLQSQYESMSTPQPITRGQEIHKWQRVSLRGRWISEQSVLLDNRMRNGVAGFEVLTPLQLDQGGGFVIVNRGWIASHGDRVHLPAIVTPTDEQSISGLALAAVPPGFSLASAHQTGPIWQKADLPAFSGKLGSPVAAWLVRQEGAAADGLDRQWPRPDFGADKHRAYALQWYAMGATVLLMMIVFSGKALLARHREARPLPHHPDPV